MSLFDSKVKSVLDTNDFVENEFFKNLRKDMRKEDFIKTQRQFYYAVIHFVSPLAFVAAAIPSYEERVNIIKNLWEEHGEGDMNQTHGQTFKELLRRLTGETDPVIPAAGEGVIKFNSTLDTVSKNASFLVSVAMVGMIERMFADISSYIGAAITERGWLEWERIIHYSVHQELDCIHAEDFFSIVRPYYNDEEKRKLIDEGLELGVRTFLDLYSDLNKLIISSK
jgi:pyrroloquinoline-quinone synthase